MPIGYWESEHLLAPADLTVIGAGIVGMSTALHYKAQHPHERVRIIERDVLGEGGTTRNAGFACFGGPGEWLDDLETLGRSKWLELIRMRAEGLRALIELLGEEALGMEWSGGWELFAPSPTGLKRSREADASLATLNEAVQPLMASILGHLAPHPLDTPALVHSPARAAQFGAHSAIHLPWEGMLHTGRMVSAFHKAIQVAGIQCLNGCTVSALEPPVAPHSAWSINTQRGVLKSRSIAICTNGFAREIMPQAEVKPAPNRVLVVRPSKMPPPGAYHIEDGYLYFRTLPDGQVLFGGGRQFGIELPPFPQRDENAEDRWDALLEEAATQWLGNIDAVSHRWTGWLGVGTDRVPLLGSTAPGLHHAVRMGGMGVAMGCGLGQQLALSISAEESV